MNSIATSSFAEQPETAQNITDEYEPEKGEIDAALVLENLQDSNTLELGIGLLMKWMSTKMIYEKPLLLFELFQTAHKKASFFKDDFSRIQYVQVLSKLYDMMSMAKYLTMFTRIERPKVFQFMLDTSAEFGMERELKNIVKKKAKIEKANEKKEQRIQKKKKEQRIQKKRKLMKRECLLLNNGDSIEDQSLCGVNRQAIGNPAVLSRDMNQQLNINFQLKSECRPFNTIAHSRLQRNERSEIDRKTPEKMPFSVEMLANFPNSQSQENYWIYLIPLPSKCYPAGLELPQGKLVNIRCFEDEINHSKNAVFDDFRKTLINVPANIRENAKNWMEYNQLKDDWLRTFTQANRRKQSEKMKTHFPSSINSYQNLNIGQTPPHFVRPSTASFGKPHPPTSQLMGYNPNHPQPPRQPSQSLNYDRPPKPFGCRLSHFDNNYNPPLLSCHSQSQLLPLSSQSQIDGFGQMNDPPGIKPFVQLVGTKTSNEAQVNEMSSANDNNDDGTFISFKSDHTKTPLPVSTNRLQCEMEAADILAKLKDSNGLISGLQSLITWIKMGRKPACNNLLFGLYQAAHKPCSFFKDDQLRLHYAELISQMYDMIEAKRFRMFSMKQQITVLQLMLDTSTEFGLERNLNEIKLRIADTKARVEMKAEHGRRRKRKYYTNELNDNFASFEKYNKGIGRKLLEKHGWREEMGSVGGTANTIPVAVTLAKVSKLSNDTTGLGYKQETLDK